MTAARTRTESTMTIPNVWRLSRSSMVLREPVRDVDTGLAPGSVFEPDPAAKHSQRETVMERRPIIFSLTGMHESGLRMLRQAGELRMASALDPATLQREVV